jgi:ureidoglycolate lyase
MVMKTLVAAPLTKDAFAPYGEVIEKSGSESFLINNGKCRRHHALAKVDVVGEGAEVIVSLFSGTPYALPHTVELVERHPLGSQAFYPLGQNDWLVIVCSDADGTPVDPQAFVASSAQGVNLKRGVWHGVLTPLYQPSDFLVVDRGGQGDNLEEVHLGDDQKFQVVLA